MRLAVSVDLACSLTAVAPRSFRPQARLAARPTCLANCIGFRWIMDNNSPYLGILGLLSFAQLISPRPKFLPTRRARAETMQMNRVADGPHRLTTSFPFMGPLPNVCHISPSARPADYPLITLVSGRDSKISRREERAFLVTAYDWCGRTEKIVSSWPF